MPVVSSSSADGLALCGILLVMGGARVMLRWVPGLHHLETLLTMLVLQ